MPSLRKQLNGVAASELDSSVELFQILEVDSRRHHAPGSFFPIALDSA